MTCDWVDQQGMYRMSSGRFRTGDPSPYSKESAADDRAFNSAKTLRFASSPQHAWAFSCRPKLAALLINETEQTVVGIEIDHAKELHAQLGNAIKEYEDLRKKFKEDHDVTNKMLLDNAGITVTEPSLNKEQ